ncbi:hypothetical protein BH10ACI4_BH10ACI4_07370 [soil metagenome]
MLSSNENIADRPIRNNFSRIVFSALAFMVLVVVIAIVFFHFNKPAVAPTPKGTTSAPTTSTQP